MGLSMAACRVPSVFTDNPVVMMAKACFDPQASVRMYVAYWLIAIRAIASGF